LAVQSVKDGLYFLGNSTWRTGGGTFEESKTFILAKAFFFYFFKRLSYKSEG